MLFETVLNKIFKYANILIQRLSQAKRVHAFPELFISNASIIYYLVLNER
jgi:hypothetical protein